MRTRAQDDADYGEGARLSVHVGVHLSPDTTVEIATAPHRGRAAIEFSGNRHGTQVTLFAGVAELRELRELLTDTLTTLTDTVPSRTAAPGDSSGSSGDAVRDRAA
jgi:hypothetical protein